VPADKLSNYTFAATRLEELKPARKMSLLLPVYGVPIRWSKTCATGIEKTDPSEG